jgi:hypothetical protein
MTSQPADVLKALAGLEVQSLHCTPGFQVFGLKWPCPVSIDYVTLDEALSANTLEFTEITDAARVSAIKVVNHADRQVFLMAGELLAGCKQDRMINASMMLPAGRDLQIPVSCVEAGRWSHRSRKFSSAGSSSHGFLRMMLSRQMAEHYKTRGRPGSDQATIWKEIARKMASMGSRSPSGALQELYKDYAGRLAEIVEILSPPSECHGAAFVIHGRMTAADLFDKPSTLAKLWSKLVRSYALESLETRKDEPAVIHSEQILEWVKSAGAGRQKWFDSPGVGHDLRIENRDLVGAALIVEQHPVHLELFREGFGQTLLYAIPQSHGA